jgi:predicted RNA-binding protein with PUA-like domain
MQPGDEALFYHSGDVKAAVGIMRIARGWKPDGADGAWASVEVEPVRPLAKPVTLKAVKAEAGLAGIELVRQSRLSVSPVRPGEWEILLGMAEK